MNFRNVLLVASTVLLSTGGAFAADKIAVIASDTPSANQYWAKAEQGAEAKGKELGVEVTFLGPAGGETDVSGQIALVEDQLTKGIKGLAIAPSDTAALVPTIQKALKQGVKVVFMDKTADVPDLTYIGTNNVPAAAIGGKYVCDHVAKGSEVAVLQGLVTHTTGQARAQGGHDSLTECGMKIVSEQPADWDTGKAQSVTENMLTAHPHLKAIVASNDNMALGAVQAVKNAKLLGKVMVVGFDGNPGAAESILNGELSASVAQRPVEMGGTAVESLVKLMKGESLPATIDTGAVLVDKDNAAKFK